MVRVLLRNSGDQHSVPYSTTDFLYDFRQLFVPQFPFCIMVITVLPHLTGVLSGYLC